MLHSGPTNKLHLCCDDDKKRMYSMYVLKSTYAQLNTTKPNIDRHSLMLNESLLLSRNEPHFLSYTKQFRRYRWYTTRAVKCSFGCTQTNNACSLHISPSEGKHYNYFFNSSRHGGIQFIPAKHELGIF